MQANLTGMNRLRFFRMKNAMLLHALLANGVGACVVIGLSHMDLPMQILRASDLFRKAQAWFLPFAFITPLAVTLAYERPIRQFFKKAFRNGQFQAEPPLAVKQRLLNEPFVQILMSLAVWTFAAFFHSTLFWLLKAGQEVVQSAFFLSLLTGLITVCIEFFLLEFVLQRRLAGYFFPGGNLSGVPGTMAISIRKRLMAMIGACNLVPFFAVMLSLNDNAPGTGPAQTLDELRSSLFTLSILFMAVGLWLTFLVSSNLTRPLKEIIRVLGAVREGDFDDRVRVTSNDELGYTGDMINAMNEGLKERDWVKETFGKYVSQEIRDEILAGRVALEGELKEATVIFADLRGFTRLAEQHSPQAVVWIINRYFARMEAAINASHGLVLQYIGDEIEAVFGAPVYRAEHPLLAVGAALAMRKNLEDLNREFREQNLPLLAHGIGIHTGQVLAASIGSPERLSYALVGDTVNLAARLQELNKTYGTDIIISEQTCSHVASTYDVRWLASADVRGRSQPVNIYSL